MRSTRGGGNRLNAPDKYFGNFQTKSKLGYTVSEVMSALAIIGVIAAITVPVLVNGYVKRANNSALKKVKFSLEQSFSLYLTDNSKTTLRSTKITTGDGVEEFLKNYIQIIKDCGTSPVASGCLSDGYKDKNNKLYQYPENVDYYCVTTTGSASICMAPFSKADNKGDVIIDINASDKPNHLDSDVYKFYYDENGYLTKEITILEDDEPSKPNKPQEDNNSGGNGGDNSSDNEEHPSINPPAVDDNEPENPNVTTPDVPEISPPDSENNPNVDTPKDPDKETPQGGGGSTGGNNNEDPGGGLFSDEFGPCTTTSGITGVKIYSTAQKLGITEGYRCLVDLGYSKPVNTFLPENAKYNFSLLMDEKYPNPYRYEFQRFENDYMIGAAKACIDAGLEPPEMYADLSELVSRIPESKWTSEKYWMNLSSDNPDKGSGYYIQVLDFDPKAPLPNSNHLNNTTEYSHTYVKRTTPGLKTMCFEKMK